MIVKFFTQTTATFESTKWQQLADAKRADRREKFFDKSAKTAAANNERETSSRNSLQLDPLNFEPLTIATIIKSWLAQCFEEGNLN